MTPDEQVELWVSGESVHNEDMDECCPDFSCCRPELMVDFEVRLRFKEQPGERDGMLMQFLGRLVASEGVDAHITGGETDAR